MLISDSGIEHKHIPETQVASARFCLQKRADLPALFKEVAQHIPQEHIAGPPFCIFQFITSVTEGADVEIGFPVTEPVESGPVTTRMRPAMEVLASVHKGALADLRQAHRQLSSYAEARGIISDEFLCEIYHTWDDVDNVDVEVQFVRHNWNELFAQSMRTVLGDEVARVVMQGSESLNVMALTEQRFLWLKEALARLGDLADEGQQYDVISRCAHVFPESQIEKLRAVYVEAKERTGDAMQAVDAVRAFMDEDPGWPGAPRREGRVIYAAKNPRDPEGYAKATSDLERRRAYCFCPLLRDHLDEGMPDAFCYCGSGWYRRQWEGAIGAPVTIKIVTSIARGDDKCEFAIQLPDDL